MSKGFAVHVHPETGPLHRGQEAMSSESNSRFPKLGMVPLQMIVPSRKTRARAASAPPEPNERPAGGAAAILGGHPQPGFPLNTP